MGNSYIEFRNRQQKEFNALPIGYAFSNEQFKQMMEGWGLTERDTDKIVSISSGGFIQKKDAEKVHDTMSRFEREYDEAIASDKTGDGFIYQMFLAELQNHEYSYTGDVEETLDELGYTMKDVYADSRLLHGLKKAVLKATMED